MQATVTNSSAVEDMGLDGTRRDAECSGDVLLREVAQVVKGYRFALVPWQSGERRGAGKAHGDDGVGRRPARLGSALGRRRRGPVNPLSGA